MICDQNDFLVKRTGWRTQAQFNAPIYGLFAMPDGVGCAVHAGAKLYFRAPDGTQTALSTLFSSESWGPDADCDVNTGRLVFTGRTDAPLELAAVQSMTLGETTVTFAE